MSFHTSAANIRIEDGSWLKADLTNGDGEQVEAAIDLNGCLGNYEGSFQWGGENFALSADNIHISIEGVDQVPVLRANLADSEGNYYPRDVNLAERIGNNNGEFYFQ